MDELSTQDLMTLVRSSGTPDEFLSLGLTVDCTLPGYLKAILEERGMKRAEVVRGCRLHPTVVYDIFAGKSRPGRDHAIMLAFGLRCSIDEAQQLLRLSNNAELWPRSRRDAIIIWCIDHGRTRAECDDELWRLSEETLLGTGRPRLR